MRGYGHSSESAKPRSLPRRLLFDPYVRGTRPGHQWQRIPSAHAPRRRAGRAGMQRKPSDPRPRRRAVPPGKARATGRHRRAEGARPDDRSNEKRGRNGALRPRFRPGRVRAGRRPGRAAVRAGDEWTAGAGREPETVTSSRAPLGRTRMTKPRGEGRPRVANARRGRGTVPRGGPIRRARYRKHGRGWRHRRAPDCLFTLHDSEHPSERGNNGRVVS